MGGGREGGSARRAVELNVTALHLSPSTGGRSASGCGPPWSRPDRAAAQCSVPRLRGPRPTSGSRPPPRIPEALPARSSHPKTVLSLLLQLLGAQIRHGLLFASILGATSLAGKYRPPPLARPPSPWRRGQPRLPRGREGAGREARGGTSGSADVLPQQREGRVDQWLPRTVGGRSLGGAKISLQG